MGRRQGGQPEQLWPQLPPTGPHPLLFHSPPTSCLLQRLVAGFPHWQIVLVDLRCHGESAALSPLLRGAHGLEAAASDVIRLLSALKLFPEMLIGHSFGGKVVLQMTKSWAQAARRVPRPVQVHKGAAVQPARPRCFRSAGWQLGAC